MQNETAEPCVQTFRISKQWQQSTKPMSESFQVQDSMWLHSLHTMNLALPNYTFIMIFRYNRCLWAYNYIWLAVMLSSTGSYKMSRITLHGYILLCGCYTHYSYPLTLMWLCSNPSRSFTSGSSFLAYSKLLINVQQQKYLFSLILIK